MTINNLSSDLEKLITEKYFIKLKEKITISTFNVKEIIDKLGLNDSNIKSRLIDLIIKPILEDKNTQDSEFIEEFKDQIKDKAISKLMSIISEKNLLNNIYN